MKLNLGDKVSFVNENLEGTVTSIIDKNNVGVTIEDDFEIPVPISQLIKVDFVETLKPETEKEIKPRISNNPPGIFLAFERIDEVRLKLLLHNNFCDNLMYAIYQKGHDAFAFVKRGEIERDETIELGTNDLAKFEQWPTLQFHFIPIDKISVKSIVPFSRELKFKAKEFHGSLKHCFFVAKQAYVFKLDEKLDDIDLEKLKQKDFSEKSAQPFDFFAKPEAVIDLHYPKLLEKGHKESQDIAALQMEVFTKSLEAAHFHKMPQIVFIHGIGNHYLKNKIHTYLSKNKVIVSHFKEADSLLYGGGATLVELI